MTDNHRAAIVNVEPHEIQRMHPLVSAAIQMGTLDPTSLRELLAVQCEWEAGEARKAFTRALAQLKTDLPTVIGHDSDVDFTNSAGKRTKYSHTSLAAVMDAITEPLTRHGFSLAWTPSTGDRVIRVTCRLTHTEGHHEEATLEAPADTSGNKSPAQAIASTVTLLSRYTALALLGIATRDMREPTGEDREEPRPTQINPRRNMAAVREIVKAGHTREEAEKLVGKKVSEWTSVELDKLREWLWPSKSAAPAADNEDPERNEFTDP